MPLRRTIKNIDIGQHAIQLCDTRPPSARRRFLLLGPLPGPRRIRPLQAAGYIEADGHASIDHGAIGSDMLAVIELACVRGALA
jgi:hypothetical protein